MRIGCINWENAVQWCTQWSIEMKDAYYSLERGFFQNERAMISQSCSSIRTILLHGGPRSFHDEPPGEIYTSEFYALPGFTAVLNSFI